MSYSAAFFFLSPFLSILFPWLSKSQLGLQGSFLLRWLPNLSLLTFLQSSTPLKSKLNAAFPPPQACSYCICSHLSNTIWTALSPIPSTILSSNQYLMQILYGPDTVTAVSTVTSQVGSLLLENLFVCPSPLNSLLKLTENHSWLNHVNSAP